MKFAAVRENSHVSQGREPIENLFAEGASRLLARAADDYSLIAETLLPGIRATVGKYVLRDDPQAVPEVIKDFIDKLQADDLCLIVACEQGNQKAWTDLVARFSATVRSAARSASSSEEGAEDLAQSIWAELHGLRIRDDGRPAGKLAYYSGRGSLAGWLRAVVAQLAVDQHRKQARLVQTEEDADFDRIIQHGQEENTWSGHGEAVNPELEISKKLAGAEMQKALATAIKQLSAEDRLLVKLYYFDGLRLREAGAVLGVHEATASRRLTRVHADLRQQVERILVDEGGWTKPETASAFSEVAIHLETDIEPLLATEGLLMKKENEIAG
jgi:RNA polymerase sigma-70 factor (ECF subfamily)